MFAELYRATRCLFLDCDGVIFDSNGFKLEALRYALAGYPEPPMREMEAHWSANGGVSRYQKLEHFFRELAPTEHVSEAVASAAARFGEYSRRAYAHCAPVPEALQLAQDAGPERCFVVSGADEAELRDVFAEKHLSALVAQICGSPVPKASHVERILQERRCVPADALFIGDGGGDFEVCRRLGVPFIYLDQYSEWTNAKATLKGVASVLVCDTWRELLAQLGVAADGPQSVPSSDVSRVCCGISKREP